MGFQDRDYYREETDQAGSPLSAWGGTWMARLILANVVLYFADALFSTNHGLMTALQLRADTWSQPLTWWRFLSYAFAHDPLNVGHLVMNMLGLWMFGRRVETLLGGAEFLRFYVVSALLGGLVWTARLAIGGAAYDAQFQLAGASGAVTAVVLLAICFFPHDRVYLFMVIPMPAWVLGVVLVLSDIAGVTGARGEQNIGFDVHLAGAAFAFIYFRLRWNLGGLWRRGGGGGNWGGAVASRRAPRLRVYGGEETPSADPESQYEELDAEADRILAKLHAQGDASLTHHERRILEDYARRMRQKHR